MNDQSKTIEMINQMIIAQYLKQVGASKVKRMVLYPSINNSSAINFGNPSPIVLVEDSKMWPQNLGKILN